MGASHVVRYAALPCADPDKAQRAPLGAGLGLLAGSWAVISEVMISNQYITYTADSLEAT